VKSFHCRILSLDKTLFIDDTENSFQFPFVEITMSSSSHHTLSRREAAPAIWQQVAHRFPAGRDCLASFLAFEAAEVLAGVKPANLVNIVNRPNACGANLYKLWKRFGEEILSDADLRAEVLRDRGDSLLVLLHDSNQLRELLETPRALRFLWRAGYPAYTTWREALEELKGRLKTEEFPHEIGLFLGYPLKDVAAFIGWSPLPFTCQGPWKIYGDPRSSLELAERHRACRGKMVRRLSRGGDPVNCVRRRDGGEKQKGVAI
jgi:hypothetical protein